jgi:twitching motility protein PilT
MATNTDPQSMPSDPAGRFQHYLSRMADLKASDLFLRADMAPTYRCLDGLLRSDLPAPSPADMQSFLSLLMNPLSRERFERSPDLDVAYTVPGCGRFRINIFLRQGTVAMVARLIPLGAVRFETLNLPPVILEMAAARYGMILVVGPTGCGKSTTLASLVHHINATRECHIVTIEDPVEFIHEEEKSIVHQRQVGQDTESFATALRHVVRQSPDVILIGEMRDADTTQTALAAALTGHLILTTLHTTNVGQSIDRMLNFFPPDARAQAQQDFAATLVGVVSMRLLPLADGSGRVPAVEVLRGTPTVRRLLAEGKFEDIYDLMKHGQDSGMVTLNQSLVDLCRRGKVTEQIALPYAPNPDEFKMNMQGMFTGIMSIDMRTQKPKGKDNKP